MDRDAKKSILLVDDEHDIRQMMHRYLPPEAFYLVSVETPRKALELTDLIGFDLLITDVILPRMNGRELANRICLRQPEIKVLFISGYSHDILVSHGIFPSQANFLAKPFSQKDLVVKIDKVITQSEAWKDFAA